MTSTIEGKGAAPDPEHSVFFERKTLRHKADRPYVTMIVHHIQKLWIGIRTVLKTCNWPSVSLKIKNLLNAIQRYAQRISSQAKRHLNLITLAQSFVESGLLRMLLTLQRLIRSY